MIRRQRITLPAALAAFGAMFEPASSVDLTVTSHVAAVVVGAAAQARSASCLESADRREAYGKPQTGVGGALQ